MSTERISKIVEDQLLGYMNGAPKEATEKFKDRLRSMLAERKPTSIKEQIPSLVRLTERIILESTHCKKCAERGETECANCGAPCDKIHLCSNDMCERCCDEYCEEDPDFHVTPKSVTTLPH